METEEHVILSPIRRISTRSDHTDPKMVITAIITILPRHRAGSLLHLELEALPVDLPRLYPTLTVPMVVANPKDLQDIRSLFTTHHTLRTLHRQDDRTTNGVVGTLIEEATEGNIMTTRDLPSLIFTFFHYAA